MTLLNLHCFIIWLFYFQVAVAMISENELSK